MFSKCCINAQEYDKDSLQALVVFVNALKPWNIATLCNKKYIVLNYMCCTYPVLSKVCIDKVLINQNIVLQVCLCQAWQAVWTVMPISPSIQSGEWQRYLMTLHMTRHMTHHMTSRHVIRLPLLARTHKLRKCHESAECRMIASLRYKQTNTLLNRYTSKYLLNFAYIKCLVYM